MWKAVGWVVLHGSVVYVDIHKELIYLIATEQGSSGLSLYAGVADDASYFDVFCFGINAGVTRSL